MGIFNKNTHIVLEILPDGKFLIETRLSSKDKPEALANLVNGVISREYLPQLLESILEGGNKSNLDDLARGVCEHIVAVQNQLEIHPRRTTTRNPLVKPTEVFRSGGEGEA